MSSLKFYILDVESTGLKAGYHELTEIGIVRFDDCVQLWDKIKCEYPERASLDALRITGKNMKDLYVGKNLEDSVDRVTGFFESDGLTSAHRCIIGHNVAFDRKFIHAAWDRCDKRFPADLWLDTKTLTNKFIKDKDTSQFIKTASGKVQLTLHACCDIMGARKPSSAHNAKADSQATYFLWKRLKEENVAYMRDIKNIPHAVSNNNENEDIISFDD
jgi:DNA polymerase III epsilon subunit-like protein